MSLDYSLTYSEYLYTKQLLAVRSFIRNDPASSGACAGDWVP